MPELPEVENTKRYLIESGIVGSRFLSTWTDSPTKWIGFGKETFKEAFLGNQVTYIERVAKYLVVHTATDHFLLHLGMTGWLRLQNTEIPAHKFTRHVFHFDDSRELRFMDSRKFGKIVYGEPLKKSLLNDPLSENFSLTDLDDSVLGRKRSIKSILMDQSIIPGLGNLYTDESLFQAKINPFTPISDLTKKQLISLTHQIKLALVRSLDEYDVVRGIDDSEPYFSMTPWDIKRKENAPCFNCDSPMQFSRINARGTYFCLQCQPI